jgi:molecular chaperone GrpE (heat shock protein)
VTPEGDNDKPDDDAADAPVDSDLTLPGQPPRLAPDLGWGRSRSAQPPGERISWERPSDQEPNQGSAGEASHPPPHAPGPSGRPARTSAAPVVPDATPSVRAPRAAETPPDPPRSIPAAPQPAFPKAPTPTTLRATPTPEPDLPAPEPPPTRTKPAVASSTPSTATTVARTSTTEADAEPPARSSTPPGPARAAIDEQLAALQAQVSVLADESASNADIADRRGPDRSGPAIAELAQQLAATQSQVAAIGAQLTTLSHRISYDIERSSQTTSERLLRDLENVSDEVRQRVTSDLGPALDDLTDQVETDRTTITTAVEEVRAALAPRLTSVGEIVDGLPLTNVEILSSLQSLGTDLEDRFTRFATRVGEQLTGVERAFTAELTRLRSQVDDLRAATARPASGAEALDRMAGQIERLVQRTPSSEEVVEALELLVSEHLEVLRNNLDTRVAALGPAMQDELEAVRAESLASMASAEEVLAERIELLEATLAERMDLALADQVEAVDGLITDRHVELLGAVQGSTAARAEEIADLATGSVHRLDDVVAALADLHELVASRPEPVAAPAASGADADALAAVSEELKALRRRISLRLEGGDDLALTPEQIAELASQIADHLR